MTDLKGTGMEFTGERVIPELVDADLLNEHRARYIFADRVAAAMAAPLQVLDAGCGSGYGAAELNHAASLTGIDVSPDAIGHARAHYGRDGVEFIEGVVEALPFADGRFDLALAFEVIEHLENWPALLAEVNRVLKPSGVLLVSTPNRDYYAESRATAGPNPFHRREFDYDEFRQALGSVFPHVRIWTQNHTEAISFWQAEPQAEPLQLMAAGAAETHDPRTAHFYLAACSQSPIDFSGLFAWLPSGANVLRERERHIAKLTGELKKKDEWLAETLEAHRGLQRKHEALSDELVLQNNWGAELTRELFLRNARISGLQEEMESRLSWIGDLELDLSRTRTEAGRLQREQALQGARIVDLQDEVHTRLTWVNDLEQQIERARAQIARLVAESTEHEREAAEKATRLEGELAACREELNRVSDSRWTRAGAKLGLVPNKPRGK